MRGLAGPDWETDGADWPNRTYSRFVSASGLDWHVQQTGRGPPLLLVHGTAASTHSWRDLMPALASDFSVLAFDLPGHGFTSAPPDGRLSLEDMATSVAELLRVVGVSPVVVAGHSAGAPIAARMCLNGDIAPALLISLNGAWLPFRGSSGLLYPVLARALFVNPLTPRLFAAFADTRSVARLIRQTGSNIDDRGLDLYSRLLRRPSHVAGALGMMANWNLVPLNRALPKIAARLLLLVGDRDRAIPPSTSETIRRRVPGAEMETLAGLGHLAHEEDPGRVARRIVSAARDAGVLPTT